MRKMIFILIVLPFQLFYSYGQEKVKVFIDAEGGSVSTGYNDVRVPNKSGSDFSLKDDLKPGSQFYYRLSTGVILNSRHTISFLYAPLSVDADGTFKKEIHFIGITIPANLSVNGNFRLTTYRLTYRYDFIKNQNLSIGIGITGAYREASISIRTNVGKEKKDDSGFTPLGHLRVAWQPDKIIGILLDGDAYRTSSERAEDFLLAVNFRISEHLAWRLGYRILEGGADNNSVYTNSLFNFASTGLTFIF